MDKAERAPILLTNLQTVFRKSLLRTLAQNGYKYDFAL